MYSSIKYIFITILFAGLISCEEIINLDLDEIEPRLVIDASITEGQECLVSLSMTRDFREDWSLDGVDGATIILSDNKDNQETVSNTSRTSGLYVLPIRGEVGVEYTLRVILDGKEYEAKATIPPAIEIDSIYIYNIQPGKDPWYSPCIVFQDPPGVDNYYHPLVYINNDLLRTIYYSDDEYRDGLEVHDILYFDKESYNDRELEIGDHIMIEFQAIDKGTYTFYRTANSFASGTNPVSNFSGDVLGCFKAYNTTIKETVITEDIIYTPPKK